MREIKFRAWDEELKTMRDIVDISQNNKYWPGWFGVKDLPIMQYTGLLDKNGKEIYEGDIVKNEFLSVNKVIFADGGFKMTIGTSVGNYLSYFVIFENIEIIGNIYENPELLK